MGLKRFFLKIRSWLRLYRGLPFLHSFSFLFRAMVSPWKPLGDMIMIYIPSRSCYSSRPNKSRHPANGNYRACIREGTSRDGRTSFDWTLTDIKWHQRRIHSYSSAAYFKARNKMTRRTTGAHPQGLFLFYFLFFFTEILNQINPYLPLHLFSIHGLIESESGNASALDWLCGQGRSIHRYTSTCRIIRLIYIWAVITIFVLSTSQFHRQTNNSTHNVVVCT